VRKALKLINLSETKGIPSNLANNGGDQTDLQNS
jgi:hypothetical protein